MRSPNEIATLMGVIDPDVSPANDYETGYVSLANFGAVMAIILAGTLGTNATVDAKFVQATDAAGAGAKDVTGKAITQLTQAGTDSDKQAILICRGAELDVANGFDHVKLVVTVAVATSDMAALVLGLEPRYDPATDAATVDEVVS